MPFLSFTCTPAGGLNYSFLPVNDTGASGWSWTFQATAYNPASSFSTTSTLQNPTITFPFSGKFDVFLSTLDSTGSLIFGMSSRIDISIGPPVAIYCNPGLTVSVIGTSVTTTNMSTNGSQTI